MPLLQPDALVFPENPWGEIKDKPASLESAVHDVATLLRAEVTERLAAVDALDKEGGSYTRTGRIITRDPLGRISIGAGVFWLESSRAGTESDVSEGLERSRLDVITARRIGTRKFSLLPDDTVTIQHITPETATGGNAPTFFESPEENAAQSPIHALQETLRSIAIVRKNFQAQD